MLPFLVPKRLAIWLLVTATVANNSVINAFCGSSTTIPSVHRALCLDPGRPNNDEYDQFRISTTKTTTRLQSTFLSSLDAFFQSSPYLAAAVTCGAKASAADWVAQHRQYRTRNQQQLELSQAEQVPPTQNQNATAVPVMTSSINTSNATDFKRNIAFLLYGSVYQAWHKNLSTITGILPFSVQALIYKYSVKEAMTRYWDDVRNHGLLRKYFLLWGPVQCITFSVIPEHYRVAFIACVSFFWLIILSSIASKVPQIVTTRATKDEQQKHKEYPQCELADSMTCNIDGR